MVGIDYDCQERMVYWTDVAGRSISRASLEAGAEPETIITSGQSAASFRGHLAIQLIVCHWPVESWFLLV